MSRLQRRSISAALRSGGRIPSWILPSAVADRNCVLEHEDAHGIHSPRRFSGFIGFSENGGFCKQRAAFSVSISNSSARSSLGTVRYGLSAVASDSSQVPEKFEYQAQWYPSLRSSRRFSTSILTPQESGVIPPELSKKGVLTTDHHTYGRYEDLVTRVTNFHNEDKGFMVLAGDVFDVPIRKDIVHRVVRWQLAKRQQGTHSTKTISEVSGTGKKPYKQKGLGKARHGTLRGPQFRHGATMHGPKPRSHAIKLQKKVRRLGLKIALSARTAEGKLLIFEDLEVPSHKTKNIVNYVSQMENTKKVLLVDGGLIDEKLKLATQNLHYVNVLPSIGLNVYSILQHDTLVMSRDAVERIVTRMHTPINR